MRPSLAYDRAMKANQIRCFTLRNFVILKTKAWLRGESWGARDPPFVSLFKQTSCNIQVAKP